MNLGSGLLLSSLVLTSQLVLAQKAAEAPAGGETHIYKTVGKLELPLYLYKPTGQEAKGPAPAIVFFFGGGWKSGTPSQFEEQCKYLAKRGMVAITVEYRVSTRHQCKIEDCISDARSAMRWVRGNAKRLGVDPTRIASGGGSAGGHLAAAVSLMDSFDRKQEDQSVSAKPDALVLFNPALALAPHDDLPEDYGEGLASRLQDRARGPVAKVSPLHYARQRQPPCIMFFGTADSLLVGAEAYRAVSVAAGNQCRIITYPDQKHGFFNFGRGGGKFYKLTVAEMDRFFVSLDWLKADGEPR